MKYALIARYRQLYSLVLMCRVRSGFYRWKTVDRSPRETRQQHVVTATIALYNSFKARYGAPRITTELQAMGIQCCLNYVARLMHHAGLKARNGKAFKYTPSPEARYGLADNLLKRRFTAERPNQKWSTDITYIRVKQKWLYLATVMDLYSRKIVGWSLDTQMTECLITQALTMAFGRRKIESGLIVHSDRGVQYRATRYQSLTDDAVAFPV